MATGDSKPSSKLSSIFRFPSLLFRGIYTLPRILPFNGTGILAGQKETSATLRSELGSIDDALNKPAGPPKNHSSIKNESTSVSSRKNTRNTPSFAGYCCFWSFAILWLLISIYLIVTGILYDCPGRVAIKQLAILQGSINILFTVILTLSIVTDHPEYHSWQESLATFGGVLYVMLFCAFLVGILFVVGAFDAWRSGKLICSDALFGGELTYVCFICTSFVLLFVSFCICINLRE